MDLHFIYLAHHQVELLQIYFVLCTNNKKESQHQIPGKFRGNPAPGI